MRSEWEVRMDEEGGRVGVKGMNGWTEGQTWSGQDQPMRSIHAKSTVARSTLS